MRYTRSPKCCTSRPAFSHPSKKSDWSFPILLRQLIRNTGDFAGTCVPAKWKKYFAQHPWWYTKLNICLGSTWFVRDGYAVSFVTILLVFIQKKGHCFDKIVILLNIWKQWMYIMLGHSITHWDWEIRYQYIHLVTYRVGYRLQWQCPNLVWKLEMGVPMCLCVKKKHKRTIIPF